MFHRVKSETSSGENKTGGIEKDTPTESKDPAEGSAEFRSPISTRRTISTVNPATKTQSYMQVSKTEEKDEETMSDSTTTTPSSPSTTESQPASPYQRPSPSTPSGVTGYTPSYTSPYAQSQPSTPSADTYTGNDRKLTIGRGITMSGEIESCDHLFVEGTVEAALKGAQMLEVAESGIFYGTVEIQEATISGRFEGDITVAGRLTIESTGVITGTISYGELQVESGAVIDGRLTPVAAKKAAAKSAPAKTESASKTSTDAVLFEDSVTAA